MLKSITLDEVKHKHLIDFIQAYRDENGTNNISSAIRFLMQKGYDNLYNNSQPQIPLINNSINKEEIKKEVLNEVLSELNSKLLDKLTTNLMSSSQTPQIQPILINPNQYGFTNIPVYPVQQNQYNQTNQSVQTGMINESIKHSEPIKHSEFNTTNLTNESIKNKPEIRKDTVIKSKKTNSSTLLSNLLSNASR